MSSSRASSSRIYVGNLPPDIRSKDIEVLFDKFGKVVWVDLKSTKGPPFAFVEFDNARDAKDAIRNRDGYDYDGYRLRVEFPKGAGRGPTFTSGGRGGADGGGSGGTRRTSHRVAVSGLPPTGSWQDLKDHMREAGDVVFTDVFKDGTGVVEFARHEDMKYALRKLDDSKFRSHEGETSYIRIREDTSSGDGGGSDGNRNGRSDSRSPPRRSRSRSPVRRSRASPSYSPAHRRHRRRSSSSRSASHSRSRSNTRSRSRS